MRTPKSSPLYEYLQSTGVLESGDKELIAQAKKQYRKEYLTKHKASYRKTKKHISIILDEHETEILERESKRHNLTII